MNYLIADFIIRIKNSALSKRKEVALPFSNINKEIGKVLVKEGFLESIKEEDAKGKKSLTAVIRYESRIPVLTDVDVISKPSLRVYLPAKRILGNRKKRQKKSGCFNQSRRDDGNGSQQERIGRRDSLRHLEFIIICQK